MAQQDNASDVSVRRLSIRSASGEYDLNPHLQELSIYEDIFQPCLTAKLIVSDSHNMPEKLPIVGEETVDIDLSLSGFKDGFDAHIWSIKPPPFHVNAITQRDHFMPKAHRFAMDLISEKYMSSLHSKVSRSYNNHTISDIVSNIYYNYIHDDIYNLKIENTLNKERVVIPNLSPIDAIDWLSKRAISETAVSVNYVYFETMSGSFFVSLNSLAKQDPVFTFYQRPRIGDSTGVEDVTKNEIKISSFEFIKQFDKEDNIKRGLYSSKLITHDIVTKKIRQYEYGGLEEWEAFHHCGNFPPVSNSEVETRSSQVKRTSFAPYVSGKTTNKINSKTLNGMVDSRIEFYPKHDNMYALSANDLYDNKVENWKLRRNNHIGVYDGLNIALKVPGQSGLRVGNTVKVILPSPEPSDNDKKTDVVDDKYLSGKYMITAIKHVFSRLKPNDPKLSYNMIIEVGKDGYDDYVPVRASRKEK